MYITEYLSTCINTGEHLAFMHYRSHTGPKAINEWLNILLLLMEGMQGIMMLKIQWIDICWRTKTTYLKRTNNYFGVGGGDIEYGALLSLPRHLAKQTLVHGLISSVPPSRNSNKSTIMLPLPPTDTWSILKRMRVIMPNLVVQTAMYRELSWGVLEIFEGLGLKAVEP